MLNAIPLCPDGLDAMDGLQQDRSFVDSADVKSNLNKGQMSNGVPLPVMWDAGVRFAKLVRAPLLGRVEFSIMRKECVGASVRDCRQPVTVSSAKGGECGQ